MNDPNDPIEALLASISDGAPVDWERAARGLPPEAAPRLAALRDVARVAEFSRGRQAPEDGLPERWGELVVLERIGAGAHAEVFRAWDPTLRREVALKLLAAGAGGAALLEEGRAAARVRHPHVVGILGIDRRDDRVGLWMELVRGATLDRQVRSGGALDVASAKRLGVEIGSALGAVHAAGLLHRDLKPANVARDENGRSVLADFGLVMPWSEGSARAGEISGTPMYMAPECLGGAPASERSDLYALGMLVWFALAGRHPFDARTLGELKEQARRGPQPLREIRPEVPPALAAVIERAISPDPAARHPGARAFCEALEAAPVTPPQSRAVHPVVIGFALLVLAAGGYAAWRASRPVPASSVPAMPAPVTTYTIQASLFRRTDDGARHLANGDRVSPGDRLSLEVDTTVPTWIYVLNEDERGERYLLFPQPLFDARNPVGPNAAVMLPGTIGGRENAWTVTSAGGREHFLIVASPEPVAELEAELGQLPAPRPDRPVQYARVGEPAIERLRGVGGVAPAPSSDAKASGAPAFDRFRTLAGRERDVRGVWVRQLTLENPAR